MKLLGLSNLAMNHTDSAAMIGHGQKGLKDLENFPEQDCSPDWQLLAQTRRFDLDARALLTVDANLRPAFNCLG